MPGKNGIKQLEIPVNRDGRTRVIHPTLLWDEENVILVDTGFPGQLTEFRAAIEGLGLNADRLSKIIITHQDRDHIGGLPFLLLGLISVLAGAFLTPALLPFIPFRSFAVKGWIVGLATVFAGIQFLNVGLSRMKPLSDAVTMPRQKPIVAKVWRWPANWKTPN